MISRVLMIVVLCMLGSWAIGQIPRGVDIELTTYPSDVEYTKAIPLAGKGDLEYYMVEPKKSKSLGVIEKRDNKMQLLGSVDMITDEIMSALNIEKFTALTLKAAHINEADNELVVVWQYFHAHISLVMVTYNTASMTVKSYQELKEASIERVKGNYYGYDSYYDREGGTVSLMVFDCYRDDNKTELYYHKFNMAGKLVDSYKTTIKQKGDVVIDVVQAIESKSGHALICAHVKEKDNNKNYRMLYTFDPKSSSSLESEKLLEEYKTYNYFKSMTKIYAEPGDETIWISPFKMIEVSDNSVMYVGTYGDDKNSDLSQGYFLKQVHPMNKNFGRSELVEYDEEFMHAQAVGLFRNEKNSAKGIAEYVTIRDVLVEDNAIFFISTTLRKIVKKSTTISGYGSSTPNSNTVITTRYKRGEIYVSNMELDRLRDGMLTGVVYRHYESYGYNGSDIHAWVKNGTVYMLRSEVMDNLEARSAKELNSGLQALNRNDVGIILSVFPYSSKTPRNIAIPELTGKGLMFFSDVDLWGSFLKSPFGVSPEWEFEEPMSLKFFDHTKYVLWLARGGFKEGAFILDVNRDTE